VGLFALSTRPRKMEGKFAVKKCRLMYPKVVFSSTMFSSRASQTMHPEELRTLGQEGGRQVEQARPESELGIHPSPICYPSSS
jgi:hypothetical protein